MNASYVKQGVQNLSSRHQYLKILLSNKKLPAEGWSDTLIEFALTEFAAMDSNNFMSNVGVGEREGRIYSGLVSRRNYGMSHGIGRSGDIIEVQPKAAGSSILYKLATKLVLHATQIAGMTMKNAVILPLATGLSLGMCLLSLRQNNPEAEYVIWSRIDQKSCLKCIRTAGFKPLIVQNTMNDDGSIETNIEHVKALMEEHGNKILCVLSTTSCFAPRQPDRVDEIAKLCQEKNVGHVINNAYGVQCPIITKLVTRATVVGRVDYVVQSTDKNFMVPVGGAIVLSPSADCIKKLSAMYPGRASMSPICDLFITLLAMGESGWRQLLTQRSRVYAYMHDGLNKLAAEFGERILCSPRNGISVGVSLGRLDHMLRAKAEAEAAIEDADAVEAIGAVEGESKSKKKKMSVSERVTFLGSMLFQRSVSGCRVVPYTTSGKKVDGSDFISWGAHYNEYPVSYFTAACAVGVDEAEIDTFLKRLEKVLSTFYKDAK